MAPRIEKTEVVSFRLDVPLTALERLPEEVGALSVVVETDGDQAVHVTAGESNLTFQPVGDQARLTQLCLAADERGLFFQRVLGPLMVRFRGDLHVRLFWNVPERNSHGPFAEVRVALGVTTYPGLSLMRNVLAPATALVRRSPFGEPSALASAARKAEEDAPEPSPSPEELEIDRLLEEGRKHFAEYQRLKAGAPESEAR